MTGGVGQTLALAAKDLRSEFRTREAINASLSFALVILFLFSFAFDPTELDAHEFSGGLLWMIFAFSGVLILNRTFAREVPNDALDGLLAAPISPSALFLGKAMSSYVLLLAVEAACLPLFAVFYNIRMGAVIAPLAGVLLLTTWAMTVIGTAFSALTINVRLRELLLPLLVLPVLTPALMAAMRLTTVLLDQGSIGQDDFAWIQMLVGFNVIFTSLSVGLIEFILVQ